MIENAEAANVSSKRIDALREELRKVEEEGTSLYCKEDSGCHFESNDDSSEVYLSDEPLTSSSKERLKRASESPIYNIKRLLKRKLSLNS